MGSIKAPVSAPGFEGRYAELLDFTVGFSPTAELNQTMEVVTKNMENMA